MGIGDRYTHCDTQFDEVMRTLITYLLSNVYLLLGVGVVHALCVRGSCWNLNFDVVIA